nr:nuclease-related domain-containing protein [uncultured Butyrivibrio sp.]
MFEIFSEFGILGVFFSAGVYMAIISSVLYITGFIFKTLLFGSAARGDEFEDKTANALKRYVSPSVQRNILFNKADPKVFYKASPSEQLMMAEAETEADIVIVNTKGIFCFECKSRKGIISGNSSVPTWEVKRTSGRDTMQNPFRQNYKHVQAIKALGYTDVYSVVCTNADYIYTYAGVDRTSKKSAYHSFLRNKEREAIMKLGMFSDGMKLFSEDIKSLPDVYTESEVSDIRSRLKSFEATKKERKFHAKLMKFRQNAQ